MKGTGANSIPSNLNYFYRIRKYCPWPTNADISKALNLYRSEFFPLNPFSKKKKIHRFTIIENS